MKLPLKSIKIGTRRRYALAAQGSPEELRGAQQGQRFGGENLLLFKKQVPSTTTILIFANFFVCSKLGNY